MKISEIPENEYPSKNSLFYVSNYETTLSSESIRYANLSARVIVDIINKLGFGSMAHEEKYMYSLSSHNHDKLYSRVAIRDIYADDEAKVLKIADITIQNNDQVSTYNLLTPKVQTYQYAEAKIGTLKFVAVNRNDWTLKQYSDGSYNIDVDDEDFDGWVFPNGGYLDTIDMQLPNLNKFMKIQCQKTTRVQYKNALKSHKHDDIDKSLTMKGTLDMYRCWIPTTRYCGKDGRTGHNGGCDESTPATIVAKFENAVCRGMYTDDVDEQYKIETKPCHNLMPVMIYIGAKEDEEEDKQKS